jgi:hypothetical protein
VKKELSVCQECEEDLRLAGYQIEEMEPTRTMEWCGMCQKRTVVRRIRLRNKDPEGGNLR